MNKIQIPKKSLKSKAPYYNLSPLWIEDKKTEAKVSFSYEGFVLIINFEIFEQQIRKTATFHNDEVHEDSCVECFLQIPNSDEYYNFELSAASFMKVGKGASRNNRFLYDEAIIENVYKKVTILSDTNWTAEIKIDLKQWNLLSEDKPIKGHVIKGNFYKCGDKLKSPHFFSLFEIDNKEPNFHLSKFFKQLVFV